MHISLTTAINGFELYECLQVIIFGHWQSMLVMNLYVGEWRKQSASLNMILWLKELFMESCDHFHVMVHVI